MARSLAVEQGTLNPKVVGSNPTEPTKPCYDVHMHKSGVSPALFSPLSSAEEHRATNPKVAGSIPAGESIISFDYS